MMRSLFSGVSGLKNHQTRMDVIGNNISNVNTTGFKSGRVTFVDSLNQTLTGAASATEGKGGVNPKQIGLGSAVSTIDTIFTDGSVQSTGKNTDLCLSGSGLFVVKDETGTYYTRNGAFEFDEEGNYVMPGSGLFVQGWMASEGNLDTNGTPGRIQVKAGKSMASTETKTASYVNNLDSAALTIARVDYNKDGTIETVDTKGEPLEVPGTGYTAATLTMSDGSKQIVTSGYYTVGNSMPISTTFTAYDSLGTAHTVPILLEKMYIDPTTVADPDDADNIWQVSLAGSNGGATIEITEPDGSKITLVMGINQLKFKPNGEYESGSAAITTEYSDGNGASPGVINVDLSGLTQYSGSSTINASADGNAAGTLKSISIDSSGVITGTYTNGIVQAEAQVAVAQFNNPSGLTKNGGSLYTESNNSGTPNIKTAVKLGVTITPSALEMSNVDIANEFSDMIITQRGFQSNSKIITVSDEMLETLINMKR